MFKLGEYQHLWIESIQDGKVHLRKAKGVGKSIQMPLSELPKKLKAGDYVRVFVLRDSDETIIATTRKPKIEMGRLAMLEVKELTGIGAFLNWGLEKDLFLPFKEQTRSLEKGKFYPVFLYVDKTGRLAASMKLKNFMRTDHRYKVNDRVKGIVYSIHDQIGAFVAVDGIYEALIDRKDIFGVLELGEEVEGRISRVRRDGKINLLLREKAYRALDHDATVILDKLREKGELPFHDRSDPQEIRKVFAMSKSSFKRALGRLYKKRMIEFVKGGVRIKKEVKK